MKTLQDEWLNQTFQLAYFIHQDRPTARRLMVAAWESLETTTLAQDKRFYYVGQRTKISFTELHLLQRLVYEKSVPLERAREADVTRPPSAERLLVHFIKHLVWITVRRNSFYVALGLGRLLHRYTTVETLELYNVILQDPDRAALVDPHEHLQPGGLGGADGGGRQLVCGLHVHRQSGYVLRLPEWRVAV